MTVFNIIIKIQKTGGDFYNFIEKNVVKKDAIFTDI